MVGTQKLDTEETVSFIILSLTRLKQKDPGYNDHPGPCTDTVNASKDCEKPH